MTTLANPNEFLFENISNLKLVSIAVREGATNIREGLRVACENNHRKSIDFLMKIADEKNVPYVYEECLIWATSGGHESLVRYFIRTYHIKCFAYASMVAAKRSHFHLVRLFIKLGVDVSNVLRYTSDNEILKYLLGYNSIIRFEDADGSVPMNCGFFSVCNEIYIIEAIITAIRNCNLEGVKILLPHLSNREKYYSDRMYVLECAIFTNQEDIVRTLLDSGKIEIPLGDKHLIKAAIRSQNLPLFRLVNESVRIFPNKIVDYARSFGNDDIVEYINDINIYFSDKTELKILIVSGVVGILLSIVILVMYVLYEVHV